MSLATSHNISHVQLRLPPIEKVTTLSCMIEERM